MRSHDGDAEAGDSTWAEAQVLLLWPLLVSDQAKLDALAKRLLSLRDETVAGHFGPENRLPSRSRSR